MIPQIRQNPVTDEDVEAVADALRSGRLTCGPATEAFEAALCEYTGARHAVSCASCTTALTMAFMVARRQADDPALIPSMTFTATAHAARLARRDVNLCDIWPTTWTMARVGDCSSLSCSVDYCGLPTAGADIIDAAHSLGASIRGSRVGTLGRVTCLSFHATKLISCGEGGAVLTNDDDLAAQLRAVRDWGRVDGLTRGPGLSGHMSEAQAALGLSQLQRIDDLLARRRTVWRRYRDAIVGISGVSLQHVPDGVEHACYLFAARLSPLLYDRAAFRSRLESRGVGTQVHYVPLHRQPLFSDDLGAGDCPVAEDLGRGVVSLPLYADISDAEVDRVINEALEALEVQRWSL